MRFADSRTSRTPPPPGTTVAQLGAISMRVHRPTSSPPTPAPALLWIHGGGYVIGNPAQDDRLCRTVANELGAVVVAPQYRRAPEHPFPTPLYDCYEALRWLASQPDINAESIAIGGASAGGGLAAAVALIARERNEIRPAFQMLSYPMLDDSTATRTDLDDRHARLWNHKSNRFGWRAYLGHAPGGADTPPLAAPAREHDLSGLPPAWIGLATCDILYEEGVTYADRLRQAGVPCDVFTAQGAYHGFDSIAPRASITGRFRQAQIEALKRHLPSSR